jgi:hypothetical protein
MPSWTALMRVGARTQGHARLFAPVFMSARSSFFW